MIGELTGEKSKKCAKKVQVLCFSLDFLESKMRPPRYIKKFLRETRRKTLKSALKSFALFLLI